MPEIKFFVEVTRNLSGKQTHRGFLQNRLHHSFDAANTTLYMWYEHMLEHVALGPNQLFAEYNGATGHAMLSWLNSDGLREKYEATVLNVPSPTFNDLDPNVYADAEFYE